MREAKSRAASTWATGSSARFMTRVGTWILARTPRMSMSRFIRSRSARAPGVVAARHHLRIRSISSSDMLLTAPTPAPVSEEIRVGHPVLGQVIDLRERFLHGDAPRVVSRPDPRRLRAPQDEAPRPLGIRRREDRRHAAALGRAEDERALAPRGVHHGADASVRSFRASPGPMDGRSCPFPTFVEPDQSSERAQALISAAASGSARTAPRVTPSPGRARGRPIVLARDLVRRFWLLRRSHTYVSGRGIARLTTRLRRDTGASTRHPPPQRDRRATSFLSDEHPR